MKTWDKDLDTLLLFVRRFHANALSMDNNSMQAALFSAVLTAFVIESYQYMKPASTNTEVILQKILFTLQSNGEVPITAHSFDADPRTSSISTFVRINALWFASLVTSVSTAFLAMLSKEWLADLHDGRGDTSTEMHMRGRQIQLRYDSMRNWRLSLVLPFLPFLLHISLLLFFAGLVDFLWYFNKTVGIVAATFVAGMVLIYIWTHIRSIFNATCPYRTSLTFLILIFVNSIRKWLSLDLPATIARAWVFVAVVAEEYWTYRDAELFRAIWDVLVASWFGRRWRALLATLADTHILPKNLWNLWARHISLGPTNIVRLREEAYIADHPDLMDARVLARMIGVYPSISDSSQLVQELCDFPSLIRYRALFIDAGAIDLLIHHLCHTRCPSRSTLLLQESDEITLRRSQTLARLLTEAEASDNRTLQFNIENVPVLWDFRLRRVPKYIPFWYRPEQSLTNSGLCRKNEQLTGFSIEDIILFSYMLRLQLVVSSSNWYTQGVKHSVDQFFDCLLFSDTINEVDDEGFTALVNATIFIGMRPIRADRSAVKQSNTVNDVEHGETTGRDPSDQEREMQAEHTSNSLSVLAALMRRRPNASFPVLRQISWGIWMLSRPIPRSLSGLLVPTITSLDALAPALAGLLSPKLERNPVSNAILVLITCLLQSSPQQCNEDSDAIAELMEHYLQFLRRLKAVISEMRFMAKLTNFLGMDAQTWRSVAEITESSDLREQVSSDTLLTSLSHIIGISALAWASTPLSASTAEVTGLDTAVGHIPQHIAQGTEILSATLDVLRATCEHLGRVKPANDQDIQDIYVLIVHFTCHAAIVYFSKQSEPFDLVKPAKNGTLPDVVTSGHLPTQREGGDGESMEGFHPTALHHGWSANRNTSSRDLAMHIKSALQSACRSTTLSTDAASDHLGYRIINTLFAALALLKTPAGGILNAHLNALSTDVLSSLRQGHTETAITGLADVVNKNLAERVLEVIRHSEPMGTEGTITGRRASVSSSDHSDDTGILRRVHRSMVNVQSDIRSLVTGSPRSRDGAPIRGIQEGALELLHINGPMADIE